MPAVSVIVPIYNVEKFIERCAHSLFKQTLQDVEFIFVNDCSPDDSVNRLKKVLEQYPYRKDSTYIINLPVNGGLPIARKEGMKVATGDYIIHCDSDDWIEYDMFEKLYHYALLYDYDMVWCDYFRSDGIESRRIIQSYNSDKEELIKGYLSSKIIASLCNRMYKRKLQENLQYPVANMTEDFVITLQLTLKATSIGYLPESLYYYYYNPLSISASLTEKDIYQKYQGMLENTEIVLNILGKEQNLEDYSLEIVCKKCSCKEILTPILLKKQYRDLWRNTYSDVNFRIFNNPFISFNTKIRAFLLLFKLYPLYALIGRVKKLC